jgi:hypothetical protein
MAASGLCQPCSVTSFFLSALGFLCALCVEILRAKNKAKSINTEGTEKIEGAEKSRSWWEFVRGGEELFAPSGVENRKIES